LSNATTIEHPHPSLGDCCFDRTPHARRQISQCCCSRVRRQFAHCCLCHAWPCLRRNTAVQSRSSSTTGQLGRNLRSSPASPLLSPGKNVSSPVEAFCLGGGALSALTTTSPRGGNSRSLYISFPCRTNLVWNLAVDKGNTLAAPAAAVVIADADRTLASLSAAAFMDASVPPP
jgi:hypothetical protein